MKFVSFEIKNYKGIENVVIDLTPHGADVFTLIGLNESGKTTLLEAISVFNFHKPDMEALFGSKAEVNFASFIPKNKIANFTGSTIIAGTVSLDQTEWESIADEFNGITNAKLHTGDLPTCVTLTKEFIFENSDHKDTKIRISSEFEITPKGARKKRIIRHSDDLGKVAVKVLLKKFPQILYFPTFLFNQPKKIILNPEGKEDKVNKHYREIINKIAESLASPLDVEQHLVGRILSNESWIERFVPYFWGVDKQSQVDAVLNEMSSHVTETIFSNWQNIFQGKFNDREISLKLDVIPRETEGLQPEISIKFLIKDGKSSYEISERSLGFRWFFSFLLFTFYKTAGETGRSILFLLDEPASNLHSKAQMELLNSFPKIASLGNQILYSTHSHYMINPYWLDQAFIVSNSAIDYDHIDESNKRISSMPTKIGIEKYRRFVGTSPDKITYFQPVIDKLEVCPSKFELNKPSVIVEGKSDYLILEYAKRFLSENKEISVIPTRGADGMSEIIGIFLGWGVPFVICLDDDKQGKEAQKNYTKYFSELDANRILTLADVDVAFQGKDISAIFDKSDIDLIQAYFSTSKGASVKSLIQRFFSEHLARNEAANLSEHFCRLSLAFYNKVTERVSV